METTRTSPADDQRSIMPSDPPSPGELAVATAFNAAFDKLQEEHRILRPFNSMLNANLGNQGRTEAETKKPDSLSADAQIAARTIIDWIDAQGEVVEISQVIERAVFDLQGSNNLSFDAPTIRVAIMKALVREAVHINRASSY